MKGRTADADGRYYLSEREYYALRELFGIISTFTKCAGELENRVRTIPGGWRDYRLIESISEKLATALLRTVPIKKSAQIKQELQHTEVLVNVVRSVCRKDSDYDDNITYIPQRALEYITTKAVENECMLCGKQGKDAKRCPLRKAIAETYMFETDSGGTECPYAGYVLKGEQENEENESD